MMNWPGNTIGFMQGRLSPPVNGRIQAFPWAHWQSEFILARQHGFHLMEWTLDQEELYNNPLMTRAGQQEIRRLAEQYAISIPSLTGDCFMQAPFYKAAGPARDQLLTDFKNIIQSAAQVGIKIILIPLVDHGRLENTQQEHDLRRGLAAVQPLLGKHRLTISFESDLPPDRLADFIAGFDPRFFGITYDIGNSAALGYAPTEEIACYGHRIVNVHVKDRLRGGTTVPLGSGAADLAGALKALKEIGYSGNYILQTARAADGDHSGALVKYRAMTAKWLAG